MQKFSPSQPVFVFISTVYALMIETCLEILTANDNYHRENRIARLVINLLNAKVRQIFSIIIIHWICFFSLSLQFYLANELQPRSD